MRHRPPPTLEQVKERMAALEQAPQSGTVWPRWRARRSGTSHEASPAVSDVDLAARKAERVERARVLEARRAMERQAARARKKRDRAAEAQRRTMERRAAAARRQVEARAASVAAREARLQARRDRERAAVQSRREREGAAVARRRSIAAAEDRARDRILALHDEERSWQRIAARLNVEGNTRGAAKLWTATAVARVVRGAKGLDTPSPYQQRTRSNSREGSATVDAGLIQSPARLPLLYPDVGLPAEAAEYLQWRATFRAAATVASDERAVRRLLAYVGVTGFLERLANSDALSRYQRALALAQPHPSTRASELSALRSFLRFAYREGWTARDLSGRVTGPHVPQRDPRPIPTHLVPAMLASLPRRTAKDLRTRALAYFLLSTGCRVSEALSVDLADLGEPGDDGLVAIRVRGAKGSRMRTVLLLPEAYAAVLEYLARRGADDCPALFVANIEARHRLTRAAAWDGHRELRRRLPDEPGMVHFSSTHVARHTLATALSAATRDARIVQEILGHRSMNSQRVYAEITDSRKREAYAPGGRFPQLLHGNGP